MGLKGAESRRMETKSEILEKEKGSQVGVEVETVLHRRNILSRQMRQGQHSIWTNPEEP